MTKIIGISGSLRASSFNSGLLRAAIDVAPQNTDMTIASTASIPLYNADEEAKNGIPSAVTEIKNAIAQADGLLLATPEYNNGIPGVFKNTIDWLSRPAGDISRVFGGKPVAVIGASPGGFGTILAQNHWLPVLKTLGTHPWNGSKLLVSRAGTHFDNDGNLVSEETRDHLRAFLEGFVGFIQKIQ